MQNKSLITLSSGFGQSGAETRPEELSPVRQEVRPRRGGDLDEARNGKRSRRDLRKHRRRHSPAPIQGPMLRNFLR